MKVSELKEKISAYKASESLKDQTVEMVMDSKKYYYSGVKKTNDKAIILVKRKDFRPFSFESLENLIVEFNDHSELFLANDETPDNYTMVTSCFLTDCFFELEAS